MLLLRKIDCYGQLLLISCTLLSIPFFYFLGTGAGLLLLGCWQLISAILNTYSFIHAGFEKRIFTYWMLCISGLVLLFFSYWIQLFSGNIYLQILFWISIISAVPIAIYYWKIYFRLIEFISLRDELDGLTKSKH